MKDEEQYLQSHLQEDTNDRLKAITTIRGCIKGLKNTNSFMLMMINRCIDYTKINKGLKLMPRRETINLVEVIKMPLECMKNIQEKIAIVLNPIPSDVCSHIITDKQWLQENLLCLLSNAVKYSSGGTVDIGVSLVSRHSLPIYPNNGIATSSMSPQKSISSDSDGGNVPFFQWDESFKSASFAKSLSAEEEEEMPATPERDLFLRFDVQDMGIGLKEEAMKSLFTPFKQAQRLAGGTGKISPYDCCELPSCLLDCMVFIRIGIV